MHQIFRMGELTVVLLKDGSETNGQFCLCEINVNPRTKRLYPHQHYTFDQTVVGMDGLMVWGVGEEQVVIGPGERLFIPRGTVHGFLNRQSYPARFLCLYTPAVFTPEFFSELQGVVSEDDSAGRTAMIDAVLERFNSGLAAEPSRV